MDPTIIVQKKSHKIIITILVVVVLVVIGGAIYFIYPKLFPVDTIVITDEIIANTTSKTEENAITGEEKNELIKLMSGKSTEQTQESDEGL